MFVELGSTADVWKAHVVRGILATYDIEAVLWHENMVYLYAPGWGPRCIVLVHEDDVDDACEILRTAPESAPEAEADSAPAMTAPRALHPDFLTLLITGILISLALCFSELILHFLISFIESGSVPPDPRALDFVPGFLRNAAIAGAGWGLIVFGTLLLLRRVPELVKMTVAMTGMPTISWFVMG
jgi:hypothetical protein